MADATTIQNAIEAGINRAADTGYTKTYDIAIFIQTELSKAGLKIVNKPSKDGIRCYRRKSNVTVKGIHRLMSRD
jgi:hypothetical protein